jgi:hypothetical protein
MAIMISISKIYLHPNRSYTESFLRVEKRRISWTVVIFISLEQTQRFVRIGM